MAGAADCKNLALCAWYVLISAALINFNKHLMHEDRFPFAWALTTVHVAMTFVTCSFMYLVAPSHLPAMEQALQQKRALLGKFVPVSFLFVLGVVCSNMAYLYCSVAFLQFMKEWNVAIVFVLSCCVGFQTCDRTKVFVLFWVILGASIAVTGDFSFSRLGFMIQVCSQLGETTRIVMQEWLLSGQQLRLDPLTYSIFVGPPTLLVLSVANFMTWNERIVPAFQALWPLILLNALLAAVLNVTIATTIKHAGAVAFTLAGIVKDIAIVTTSTYISGNWLNRQEIGGFTLATVGILYWCLLKSNPKDPMVSFIPKLLGQPQIEEHKNLLPTSIKNTEASPEADTKDAGTFSAAPKQGVSGKQQ